MPRPRRDFDRLAQRYDELRPLDENWWRLFGRLVDFADLRGRRALDLGCGTGRLAAALAERSDCTVTGVDFSADMLGVARKRVPPEVTLVRGSAEALPFADAAFERAVLWLVAHLLDQPVAFRELLRVLEDDGRAAIVTGEFDNWSGRFFPSVGRIEQDDGGPRVWAQQLVEAGFARTAEERLSLAATLTRAEALWRLRGRYTSSLLALDDDEFEAGLLRAEQELPERFVHVTPWTILVAHASN
jgi:ubiquinone/menaquinone biosynthesis C-methylase UbiE